MRPSDSLILVDDANVLIDNDVDVSEGYKRVGCKRWIKEYLSMLHGRHKVQRDVRKGHLILVVDTAAPRVMWRKGLVTDVYARHDGHVRKAVVRRAGGSFLKGIRSICLLEGNGE